MGVYTCQGLISILSISKKESYRRFQSASKQTDFPHIFDLASWRWRPAHFLLIRVSLSILARGPKKTWLLTLGMFFSTRIVAHLTDASHNSLSDAQSMGAHSLNALWEGPHIFENTTVPSSICNSVASCRWYVEDELFLRELVPSGALYGTLPSSSSGDECGTMVHITFFDAQIGIYCWSASCLSGYKATIKGYNTWQKEKKSKTSSDHKHLRSRRKHMLRHVKDSTWHCHNQKLSHQTKWHTHLLLPFSIPLLKLACTQIPTSI